MAPLPVATEWFIDFADAFLTEPVRGEVPSPRPSLFVQVQNAGGEDVTKVTAAPRVMVDSWGSTTAEAARLALKVDDLVRQAAGYSVDGVVCLYATTMGLPVEVPDPASSQARFRQTVVLHFRRA